MFRITLAFWGLLLCLLGQQAYALSQEPASPDQAASLNSAANLLPVTGEAIPWEVFEKTGQNEDCKKTPDGLDDCIIRPTYTSEIKSLDKKEVTLMGFIFPLEQSDAQSNFLLGPYPVSCPFHFHTPANLIIEVIAKTPVPFSYEPVTLKGTLSVRFNEDTGTFYYLENATMQ